LKKGGEECIVLFKSIFPKYYDSIEIVDKYIETKTQLNLFRNIHIDQERESERERESVLNSSLMIEKIE